MTPSRPYLIRSLYKWIVENHCTPYIVVDTHSPDVQVPIEYINKDGSIILNIAPDAVYDLKIYNSRLEFNASFSGISRFITAPIESVQAIYAQENGKGMEFGYEPSGDLPPDDSRFGKKQTTEKKVSHLKVVK